MPRGRRPKPIALHLIHGTYRPDRHRGALEIERRLNATLAGVPQRCALCGHEFDRGEWMAANQAESAAVCLCCLAGGVIAYQDKVLDMIPREILENYLRGTTDE